ncbi:MAG: hypothetical protein ACTS9Y_01360 [Methylophilus sp.]|uniref:hypothetical protein n=1 Tax=Methylophilus sp. TaxID=29541 RepID=UPI003F9F7607
MIVGGKKVIVREVQQDIYHKLRGDGYSDALARIYAGRGALPSQYLEKSILRKDNLQQAALAGEIIGEHIISGNTICICADYDADGVSGLAVVARSIRAFGGKVISKCPLRTVGYGLNKYMVQEAKNEGCCALITVDLYG